MESQQRFEIVDHVINGFSKDPTRLVEILMGIQRQWPKQFIPIEVATYVGQQLAVPLSQVYDVISFYSALSNTPRGEVVVQFCDSLVCRVTGSDDVKVHLNTILGIDCGTATEDGHFFLESVPCFGACDISPAIRVNGQVFGHLHTEADVRAALSGFEKVEV